MLPNLKTLILANNKLDDISPLAGCAKLKTLDISSNKLTQLYDSLNNLKELKKLKKLDLHDNPFYLSYLYKHETLLQLRGLECLNGEKITEADFEISEKLKQKYFEVEGGGDENTFGGKSRFSKKLRNLAEVNKEEDISDVLEASAVSNNNVLKDQEIEKLKEELCAKDEKIRQLEGELNIEKSYVKGYEVYKFENEELKKKIEALTSNFNTSECRSQACNERALTMRYMADTYLDEIRALKSQLEGGALHRNKSALTVTSIGDKKDDENRKQRKAPTSAIVFSNQTPEIDDMLPKVSSANDAEDMSDADIEEFLRSTLDKLTETKSMLKDIPMQKAKDPVAMKPSILAMKFGKKKNLFAKDKKLVPVPKPN